MKAGPSSEDRARSKRTEQENLELEWANRILRKVSEYFGPGGARPPIEVIIGFIDEHREVRATVNRSDSLQAGPQPPGQRPAPHRMAVTQLRCAPRVRKTYDDARRRGYAKPEAMPVVKRHLSGASTATASTIPLRLRVRHPSRR